MRKKQMIPTKRKRLKDKESQDLLTIKLLSLINELHSYKNGSVSISTLTKQIEYKLKNKIWY